jgi:hypothetical protein
MDARGPSTPSRAAAVLSAHPRLTFLLGASLILLGSWTALHSTAAARHPDAMAAAVAIDLTITAALLAWLTLVRAGAAASTTLLLVLSAGAAVAARFLPPHPWRLALAVLGEAAFLALLGYRTVRLTQAWRTRGRRLPLEDALRAAAREALGPSRMVEALATEAAIITLALGSWRRAPDVPPGCRPFSLHRRSGHGAVVVAIALAGVGEVVGTHLLVGHWSERWAWAATALGVYGLIWLVGDFRAVVLRPVLLSADALEIRVGLRWRLSVPLAAIRTVCVGPAARGHPGAFRLSPLGPPTLYLHLIGPVEAAGLFGLRRRADLLGLRVDEPEVLAERLRAAVRPSHPR